MRSVRSVYKEGRVADRSRQDWRVNWRTESSKIRRRMSVFGRFIHSESVIVKTSGKRLGNKQRDNGLPR
jgi:hypothetical protein